jgi:hypothetical protein
MAHPETNAKWKTARIIINPVCITWAISDLRSGMSFSELERYLAAAAI